MPSRGAVRMFYVYILKCSDGTYYVGQTDNIDFRMYQHTQGLCPNGYTSTRLPVQLVYMQECQSRQAAKFLEAKLKRWSGKKKAALAQGQWDAISWLANRRTEFKKDQMTTPRDEPSALLGETDNKAKI